MSGREAERDVHANAFGGQLLGRLETFRDQRALHHDVLVDLSEFPSLLDHRLRFDADHLGADRPVHELTDLQQQVAETAPFLRRERGVGRDAVQ